MKYNRCKNKNTWKIKYDDKYPNIIDFNIK